MTMIVTELQKWKRNKIVWSVLALTVLLVIFAIERACSISRSSPYMDSFGDLYTLAFKNLTSLFLPIILGMFATTLFYDEQKNDTSILARLSFIHRITAKNTGRMESTITPA